MLKSASPVAVLFVSWAWRVKEPALGDFLNILLIVAGVAAASAGEVHFSFVGFLYQLGGIVFEALRLVMIQIMLSGEGLNMSPLVGLYYYAPVCAVMNVAIAYVTEIPNFKMEDLWNTGVGMLFANACLAFVLNIASVMLVGTPLSRLLSQVHRLTCPDRQDVRPRHDADRDLQEHPPHHRGNRHLGQHDPAAAGVWVLRRRRWVGVLLARAGAVPAALPHVRLLGGECVER